MEIHRKVSWSQNKSLWMMDDTMTGYIDHFDMGALLQASDYL